MPFLITTWDKPDSFDLRLRVRPDHLAYMTANVNRILGAFARVDEANQIVDGGVVVLDTEDRGEAERFVREDPFTKAKLFENVTVERCRKAFFNYERLV